jgi:hypothetical protein
VLLINDAAMCSKMLFCDTVTNTRLSIEQCSTAHVTTHSFAGTAQWTINAADVALLKEMYFVL